MVPSQVSTALEGSEVGLRLGLVVRPSQGKVGWGKAEDREKWEKHENRRVGERVFRENMKERGTELKNAGMAAWKYQED